MFSFHASGCHLIATSERNQTKENEKGSEDISHKGLSPNVLSFFLVLLIPCISFTTSLVGAS